MGANFFSYGSIAQLGSPADVGAVASMTLTDNTVDVQDPANYLNQAVSSGVVLAQQGPSGIGEAPWIDQRFHTVDVQDPANYLNQGSNGMVRTPGVDEKGSFNSRLGSLNTF